MLSSRSKASLIQYLALHERSFLRVLLEKHGLYVSSPIWPVPIDSPMLDKYRQIPTLTDALHIAIASGSPDQLCSLINELVRTHKDLRQRVTPRYRHEERWKDLVLCLRMDGYAVGDCGLVPIDPVLDAAPPAEDDLTKELHRSALPEIADITGLIDRSAEALRQNPPDFNSALSNMRVALESTARSIAISLRTTRPNAFNEKKWGSIIAFLRSSDFIVEEEEDLLTGVYGFLSSGAHRPLGADESETATLGRSIGVLMCYLLIKRYNSFRQYRP